MLRRAAPHFLLVLLLAGLTACAAAPTRPERSTLGCGQEMQRRAEAAAGGDKVRHCVAAGLIAMHCSRTEAYLLSAGKELRDLFGAGHAEWADWRADRAGIACASRAQDEADLLTCCASVTLPD